MTFKTLTLSASVILASATFAFAQDKPNCDEVSNPKAGDNCEDVAATPPGSGELLTAAPFLFIAILAGALGGGGSSGTSGTGTLN
jgi:hypothetical protein